MPSPNSPTHEVTIDRETEVPAALDDATLASLVEHVLSSEGVTEPWQVGIRFVDDDTMQSAHLEFMDLDEPTDIMTFPYDAGDLDFADVDGWPESVPGGDILISVDRAAANAREIDWSTEHELQFLVAHGLLHLLGWDDATDDDRAAMLERQEALISDWHSTTG